MQTKARSLLAALILSVFLGGALTGPAYATYWCEQTYESETDTGYTSADGQYMEVHHTMGTERVEYDESGTVINREDQGLFHDEYHWRLISDPNDSGYCPDYPDATLC